MKVLLINGSPNEHGCTDLALREVARTLEDCGVQTELLWIGKGPIRGCVACGGCRDKGRCVFDDDPVNRAIERMQQADGLVVGSPVYYASANGSVVSLLDRMFYATGGFPGKPAAAVVSARRAGTTASLDELNKYFTICGMPNACLKESLIELDCTMLPIRPSATMIAIEKKTARKVPNLPLNRALM